MDTCAIRYEKAQAIEKYASVPFIQSANELDVVKVAIICTKRVGRARPNSGYYRIECHTHVACASMLRVLYVQACVDVCL